MKKTLLIFGAFGITTATALVGTVLACTNGSYSANFNAQQYSTNLDGNNIGALTGVVRGFAQKNGTARTMVVQGWGSYWWETYPNRPDGHINWIEFAISTPNDNDYLTYSAPEPPEQSSWSPPSILSWAISSVPSYYGAVGGMLMALIQDTSISSVSHEGSPGPTFYQQKQYPSSPAYTTNQNPDCNTAGNFLKVPFSSWHNGDNITVDYNAHYVTGNFSQGYGYTDQSGWVRATGAIH